MCLLLKLWVWVSVVNAVIFGLFWSWSERLCTFSFARLKCYPQHILHEVPNWVSGCTDYDLVWEENPSKDLVFHSVAFRRCQKWKGLRELVTQEDLCLLHSLSVSSTQLNRAFYLSTQSFSTIVSDPITSSMSTFSICLPLCSYQSKCDLTLCQPVSLLLIRSALHSPSISLPSHCSMCVFCTVARCFTMLISILALPSNWLVKCPLTLHQSPASKHILLQRL